MTDNWRFVIFVVASSAVFAGALLFMLRSRPERSFRRICLLTGVVVVGGMLFARFGHLYANLRPAVYYGVPASYDFLVADSNSPDVAQRGYAIPSICGINGSPYPHCVLASTWMARLHAIPSLDTIAARVDVVTNAAIAAANRC
jgi:hypothetical protein